jgi:hypothetical protein
MYKWGNIWGDTKRIIGGILREYFREQSGDIQGIFGGILRE